MAHSRTNVWIFVLITLGSVAGAVIYTLSAARSARSSAGQLLSPPTVPSRVTGATGPSAASAAPAVPPGSAAPPPPTGDTTAEVRSARPDSTGARPYLIALNVRQSPDLGTVEFAALDAIDKRSTTSLRCEVVYFAAGTGICLSREIRRFSAQTVATFVDAAFQPLFNLRTDGIPSRARISPDGRYAAFTVFVSGHSYSDAQLSTTTMLVDIAARATLATLEEFEVLQDGTAIKSLDFNFWGVTFERDSNFFYATLRTRGVNYLVRGDVARRSVSITHKGVECPSLSPDGTRIAFKRLIAPTEWHLAVLNLRTMDETPLPGAASVDDQPEWLDNEHLLYALPDPAPWMNIMMVPTDGRSQPTVFAKGASSPAVVKQFRK